jgi:hypothetical protein
MAKWRWRAKGKPYKVSAETDHGVYRAAQRAGQYKGRWAEDVLKQAVRLDQEARAHAQTIPAKLERAGVCIDRGLRQAQASWDPVTRPWLNDRRQRERRKARLMKVLTRLVQRPMIRYRHR